MAFRLLRRGAATGVALLASSVWVAGAGAQDAPITGQTGVGPAKSVDLRTAPTLQNPPMSPINFNRPTPRWAAERMRRLPPDTTGGGRAPGGR